ncbi:4673_t:CDS:2 [Racocetra fulgida]|uniref:4673_t:CDS:1 n=1 Tax=Racocetra fulgida TaxID=60492 RepID=A0A9N8VW16_9GLOM|nr:4673_t:CDS:2 [Racocetra fulgida]
MSDKICEEEKQNLNPISAKKTKLLKTGLSTRTASSISSTNFEDNNLEVSEPFFVQEISEEDIINIFQMNNENNRYDNDDSRFLYSVNEIEEQISTSFQILENCNDEPVKFAFEIELDINLSEYINFDLKSESLDLEEIKNQFPY